MIDRFDDFSKVKISIDKLGS